MPPRDTDCDNRFVLVTKTHTEVSVFADDVPVKYLHTGDMIFKYYVPDWWTRSYMSYIQFVSCLQKLWNSSWISAIKLVRTQCDISLKDAKEFTEDLCRPLP